MLRFTSRYELFEHQNIFEISSEKQEVNLTSSRNICALILVIMPLITSIISFVITYDSNWYKKRRKKVGFQKAMCRQEKNQYILMIKEVREIRKEIDRITNCRENECIATKKKLEIYRQYLKIYNVDCWHKESVVMMCKVYLLKKEN